MQEASGEIWGTYDTVFGAPAVRPSVDAYVGPLPDEAAGIEFETDIEADVGLPPGRARWSGPRTGVEIREDWALITATKRFTNPQAVLHAFLTEFGLDQRDVTWVLPQPAVARAGS